MSVNHGRYYVDLTASKATQDKPLADNVPPKDIKRNIFVGGKTYNFFLVYAKEKTEQTYQMYVGPGFDPKTGVKLIRADLENPPFVICPNEDKDKPQCKSPVGGDPSTLQTSYDPSTDLLTVTLNLSAFANDFTTVAKELCQPTTFCEFLGNKCVGKPGVVGKSDGLGNLTQAERNITCGRAGEDADCPKGGCIGFSVTLPAGFVAQDQTTANDSALVKNLTTCFPHDANWDITPTKAPTDLAGACVGANAPMKTDFCSAQ